MRSHSDVGEEERRRGVFAGWLIEEEICKEGVDIGVDRKRMNMKEGSGNSLRQVQLRPTRPRDITLKRVDRTSCFFKGAGREFQPLMEPHLIQSASTCFIRS